MLGLDSVIPRRSSEFLLLPFALFFVLFSAFFLLPFCRALSQADPVSLTVSRRHLVRLWLRDPEYAWKTPEVLQQRWDYVYKGVTSEASVLPLEPYIRNASKGVVNQ
jgi:hypothetical protein